MGLNIETASNKSLKLSGGSLKIIREIRLLLRTPLNTLHFIFSLIYILTAFAAHKHQC